MCITSNISNKFFLVVFNNQIFNLGMKYITILLLILGCIGFTSCSMTLPVSGRFEDGSQTLTGTATGYLAGDGKISLVTSKGLTIEGDFVYVTARQGEGTFTASDGRSGSFSFVSTGTKGTGTGYLGKDKVIFTFGIKK